MRIIAATNKSLEEEVKAGHFRKDLYYRLNVVNMHLPPLRERTEDDLKRLFRYFVNNFNKIHKKFISDILNEELLKAFRAYNWPGNIREFENKIEGAIIGKKGNVLLPSDFQFAQEDTSPIDVNSISDKYLRKEINDKYFIEQLKGDSRRLVIIDVYNKLYKKNDKPPTSKELADYVHKPTIPPAPIITKSCVVMMDDYVKNLKWKGWKLKPFISDSPEIVLKAVEDMQ